MSTPESITATTTSSAPELTDHAVSASTPWMLLSPHTSPIKGSFVLAVVKLIVLSNATSLIMELAPR